MDSIKETKIDESVQRVANALSVHLDKKQDVELDEWTVSDVEIAMKKKYGKVDKKAIEKLKKVQHMGNVDRNDLVKVGHGKLNVESVELDEAKPEYEVKYAKIASAKVRVTKFMTLDQAKEFLDKVKKDGMNGIISKGGKPVKEEAELDEAKYDIYHKDFSSAMQHAYVAAKKMYGITIDPKEIDNKVATGPKKPSKDKTNRYRLKGDKGTVQIQVANLDNKKYELNMYKEEVELDEKTKWKMGDGRPRGGAYIENEKFWDLPKDSLEYIIKDAGDAMKANPKARKATSGRGNWADQVNDAQTVLGWRKKNGIKEEAELDEAKYEYDGKVVKISKKEFAKVSKDYKNSTKGKERMMILDPKTQGSISVPVQFEEVKVATIKVGEDAIDTDEDIHYAVVKDRKVEAVGEKKEMIEYCKENGGRVWKTTKNIGELVEEVELDENAAVDALEKQAGVSNPTDKKFFQKAAELLKKKDYVARGQLIYDYDTAPREFAMSAIRDKDRASFKKMYGNQKGYFSTMKPKGLKEEVDESVQRAANAISHHEARKMSPVSRARQDALRDIGKDKSKDDDEVKATDADREKADRNILNKLKKSADVKGNYEIKFDKGPSKKVPYKIVKLALIKHAKMKPADKLKFQKQAEKSYVDFLKALKDM